MKKNYLAILLGFVLLVTGSACSMGSMGDGTETGNPTEILLGDGSNPQPPRIRRAIEIFRDIACLQSANSDNDQPLSLFGLLATYFDNTNASCWAITFNFMRSENLCDYEDFLLYPMLVIELRDLEYGGTCNVLADMIPNPVAGDDVAAGSGAASGDAVLAAGDI